jgi:hypothetical protein
MSTFVKNRAFANLNLPSDKWVIQKSPWVSANLNEISDWACAIWLQTLLGLQTIPILRAHFESQRKGAAGRNADVTITNHPIGIKRASVERLEASGIDAKDGVVFQGRAVNGDGQFRPRVGEPPKSISSKVRRRVPRYSAAVIRLD